MHGSRPILDALGEPAAAAARSMTIEQHEEERVTTRPMVGLTWTDDIVARYRPVPARTPCATSSC